MYLCLVSLYFSHCLECFLKSYISQPYVFMMPWIVFKRLKRIDRMNYTTSNNMFLRSFLVQQLNLRRTYMIKSLSVASFRTSAALWGLKSNVDPCTLERYTWVFYVSGITSPNLIPSLKYARIWILNILSFINNMYSNCSVDAISMSHADTGMILGLRPASERRRYKETPSLIGWAQTQNQPWDISVHLEGLALVSLIWSVYVYATIGFRYQNLVRSVCSSVLRRTIWYCDNSRTGKEISL